jgi:hypothetical protein
MKVRILHPDGSEEHRETGSDKELSRDEHNTILGHNSKYPEHVSVLYNRKWPCHMFVHEYGQGVYGTERLPFNAKATEIYLAGSRLRAKRIGAVLPEVDADDPYTIRGVAILYEDSLPGWEPEGSPGQHVVEDAD